MSSTTRHRSSPILQVAGFCTDGTVDGILGPGTEAAFMAFQRTAGMKDDHYAGPPAAVSTQPQPDLALRAVGAGVNGSLDVAKVSRDLERIADGVETIAEEAATSLAKNEEAGTARTLGSMAEMLARLARGNGVSMTGRRL